MLDLVTGLRSSHGTHILPLGGSAPMRTILQKLRANKIILLTADRAIEGQSKEMSFFGATAPMPIGVPHLAQRTGAIVVGAFGWYASDGTIHGSFVPLSLALSEEQRTNTDDLQQAIVTMLEQGISEHPEQWMVFEPLWTERPSAMHKAMVMKDS
jgi:lauroyl/myristoyl acyltransferase